MLLHWLARLLQSATNRSETLRYAIVGGLASLANARVGTMLGASPTASIVGFMVGGQVSFWLHYLWTFKTYRSAHWLRPLCLYLPANAAVAASNGLLLALLLWTPLEGVRHGGRIAYWLAFAAVVISGFMWNRFVVFRDRKKSDRREE